VVVSAELVAVHSTCSSALCMTWNQTLQEVERMKEVGMRVLTVRWLKVKKPTQKGKEDISSAGTRVPVFVGSRDWELQARVVQERTSKQEDFTFQC